MSMREQDVLDPRRAGQVERYHVFPHITRTTTGEHSWQVARLLLALWPDCPRHVLVHGLVHDIGELWAGDASWHAKKAEPNLKVMLDEIEADAHIKMMVPWALPGPQRLSDPERRIFKAAETLEMLEWALHERNLGNRYAALVEGRCRRALEEQAQGLPNHVNSNLLRYLAQRDSLEGAVHGEE